MKFSRSLLIAFTFAAGVLATSTPSVQDENHLAKRIDVNDIDAVVARNVVPNQESSVFARDGSSDSDNDASAKKLASAFSSGSDSLEQVAKKLEKLDKNKVTKEQLKPVIDSFETSLQDLNKQLKKLKKDGVKVKVNDATKHKHNRRDAGALIVPAVSGLVKDLNKVLQKLLPLVNNLTDNLGLSTVTDLLKGLETPIKELVHLLEALLLTLSPALGALLDPLLHILTSLLAALGLNLNAGL